MKKILRIIVILFIIGVITGTATVYYVFNKPHRNIAKEKPSFYYNATELYAEFSQDELTGNDKFGDKVIQVKGEIVEKTVQNNNMTLVLGDMLEGVTCDIDSTTYTNNIDYLNTIDVGNTITLKGKCDGLDMIMGVVLTRCLPIIEEEN